MKINDHLFRYGRYLDFFQPFWEEFPEELYLRELDVEIKERYFRHRKNMIPVLLENLTWYHSQNTLPIMREIFKFTPQTDTLINENIQKSHIPEPYIAFHIRRGDRLAWEAQYMHIQRYLEKVPDKTIKNVFIATDDFASVEELINLKTYNVFTSSRPEHRGTIHERKLNDHNRHDETIRFLTDIEICKRSEYFVGSVSCVYQWIQMLHKNPEHCFNVQS